MKKVIILWGLPASGKTTWAKKMIEDYPNKYKRVNKDDLREMLDSGKWSPSNEKFILKIRDSIILKALKNGNHVIVDDTNLAFKHVDHIEKLVNGKARVLTKYFNIEVEEAIKRDLLRNRSVGERVIRQMYNQYLKPKVSEYIPPKGKPGAFIFDVDGTLAKINGRSPYDWEKVGTDIPNVPIINMLRFLSSWFKIIIFSGRDGICEEKTIKWLLKHKVHCDHFDMRKPGDTRKDSIVKKEMFDKIKDDFHILGVFDDRNQVVEMWRSIGLTCYQVDDGNF